MIRKQDGFGADNYSYKQLTIIISPAFFETGWFYAAMILLAIVLVGIYARLRLAYIRRKNRQLEELVEQRTAEWRNALTALSISEQNIRKQLHIREILFTAISHDIGSPLKYITMMAEDLKTGLEKIPVSDDLRKFADGIHQSGHYLFYLTRNLLQYLRISRENSALYYEEFNLHQLVENKVIIFQPMANDKSLRIINEVPIDCHLYNNPLLLEVIIHNLLDNAVKATRAGTVTINMRSDDNGPTLIISDTGPGMRPQVANYFKDDYVATEEDASAGSYRGFGLSIVKELTSLIGVKVTIDTDSEGASVHLSFINEEIGAADETAEK
jgi:signal transduction histidine kinase